MGDQTREGQAWLVTGKGLGLAQEEFQTVSGGRTDSLYAEREKPSGPRGTGFSELTPPSSHEGEQMACPCCLQAACHQPPATMGVSAAGHQ